ncbi:unnamed protein product [Zymoseptoria tritici ST99CH_1A5]|uniref:Secreted protein n=3 Tax=Zymoseptoria tritici TaxID=1047171 RepID=A0A1X7RQW8_ZYMT9|nr:unnamed protein product [Zymoseptoria tritici ST99CH_3D7]SMR50783.1 unnamed protein product [Zymoseptoria tritici ST99CH_1E4]SMY23487.1 unnamed protein product [Zymoseptoria tritici ST99CH_1A5]
MQIFRLSIILALTSTVAAFFQCVKCDPHAAGDCQANPWGTCSGNAPEDTGYWSCIQDKPCYTPDFNDLHDCTPHYGDPGQHADCT